MTDLDKLARVRRIVSWVAIITELGCFVLNIYLGRYWYSLLFIVLAAFIFCTNRSAEKAYKEAKRWRQKLREEYGDG